MGNCLTRAGNKVIPRSSSIKALNRSNHQSPVGLARSELPTPLPSRVILFRSIGQSGSRIPIKGNRRLSMGYCYFFLPLPFSRPFPSRHIFYCSFCRSSISAVSPLTSTLLDWNSPRWSRHSFSLFSSSVSIFRPRPRHLHPPVFGARAPFSTRSRDEPSHSKVNYLTFVEETWLLVERVAPTTKESGLQGFFSSCTNRVDKRTSLESPRGRFLKPVSIFSSSPDAWITTAADKRERRRD